MKKVLLLTTTPTVGGNGDALIEAAAETARGCGAEVKRLNGREMDIHPCRGCYGCARTGECVQKDDLRTVLSALHECDGLIAEAPIYYNCMAAQALLVVNRLCCTFACKNYPLEPKKKIGVLLTCTGSEMSTGAVITHEEKKLKSGIFGARADFAFLDPTYTLSVPFGQVISGAFDTLSHAMETYFGKPDENNLSDDLGEAVMRSVIRNIRVLMQDHENYEARSELAWASAMAENGVLKIGKVTDFQAHQIEHSPFVLR